MAGIWHGFNANTNICNTYVLLANGARQDYPSEQAAVRVKEFVDFNSSAGSINFYCKIEAKLNGSWQQVTDAKYCFAADKGVYDRLNLVSYYTHKFMPNGTELRAYGRSGQYLNVEPMRGNINFN